MLYSNLHGKVKYKGCLFGIEAEIENQENNRNTLEQRGRVTTAVPDTPWALVYDGSLRNYGVEYVLRRPLSLEDSVQALEQLFSSVVNPDREYSNRTSVHVHVNVQDLTEDQILALYVLSGAVEPLMQRMVRAERHTNLFCLPIHMCSTAISHVTNAYSDRANSARFCDSLTGIGKYSSVNTGRLVDLGTIEYRAMHGTDDVQLLSDWLIVLRNLRSMAESCSDVLQVIDLLQYSEARMCSVLFDGCSRTYYGAGWCTYDAAVAASLAMISSAKSARSQEVMIQYAHVPIGSTISGLVPNVNNIVWRAAAIREFRSYRLPPEQLIVAVSATPSGSYAMDMYHSDGYVYWVSTAGAPSCLLCRRQVAAPVHQETTVLTFNLGV